jgi:hypothetical protein
MTYFLRNGNTFRTTDEKNLDIHTKLPAGNYVIKTTPFGEMYFEAVDNFEFKTKRYGDNVNNTQRILNTFMSREASTGVMLTGEKGSGKSLLAKTISMEAAKLDIPTIIINTAWHGDAFNTFIQSIEQPAILLFDEFEKVYDQGEQESLLTLLDGVFPSKKLFIITCNDKWRVDTHMRNRPGRIFYMLDFKGLSIEFIVEYCNDNLINKSYVDRICSIAGVFSQFNFDMLKALVEEMNRYDESPEAALEMLNVRPEFDSGCNYNIKVTMDGVDYVGGKNSLPEEWRGNPFQKKISLEFYKGSDTDEDSRWYREDWSNRDIVRASNDTVIFVNKDGTKLTLTKAKEVEHRYYAF